MSLSTAPSSPASLTLLTVPAEPSFREKLGDALRCSDDDESPDYTFATGGSFRPPDPCLKIDDTPISLPLTPEAAENLSETSQPAPFGRGPDTLVDQSVRRCFQVDANRINLSTRFGEHLYELVAGVSETLGVYDDVDPNLYKLVLYRDGGFFVPHRDTEKEDGMFATLIIQLPCKHEEGGLVVWHRGEEKTFVNAKDSDKSYFYSAFYADCEHEVLTVSGNRLVLVYNLVRSGHEYPESIPYMENKLRAVTRDWEKVQSGPNKLVVSLHHNYTDANLSFSLLKGRDAIVVDSLRSTGLFDVYLALVQKTKHGSAEEDWNYGNDPYAEVDDEEEEEEDTDGDHSDGSLEVTPESPYADTSGDHKMIECLKETFETLEWIGEDDNPAQLGKVTIDVDKELVDDDDPFTGAPDEEDYEVTGNEGATVDYFYRKAVIVFWPKSRRYANICSIRYGTCVDELLSTQAGKSVVEEKLGTILQYATENVEKARPYFLKLLEFACHRKDALSVLKMLPLFGKPMRTGYDMFRGFCPWESQRGGNGPGLCTRAHVDAFFEGIKLCGFEKTKEHVQTAVTVTDSGSLHHCADFAIRLSKMHDFEKLCALVAKCTAHETMSRANIRVSNFDCIAEMMLTLPSLANLRDIFLTKAKSMQTDVLYQVILALHKHCTTADRLPNLFEQLVRTFSRKTLAEQGKGYSRQFLRNQSGQIGDVLSILLDPPRDERVLGSFVQDITDHGSEAVLKTVLAKQKIPARAGDAAVSKLAELRVPQLLLQKPEFSHRQPKAKMPGHPAVQDFLRGETQVMEYKNFSGIKEARNFAKKFPSLFDGRPPEKTGYSADAVADGIGRKARVVISKNEGVYLYELKKYRADCDEFKKLRRLLPAGTGASLGSVETGDGNGNKRRRIGGKASTEVVDLTYE